MSCCSEGKSGVRNRQPDCLQVRRMIGPRTGHAGSANARSSEVRLPAPDFRAPRIAESCS